MIHHCIYVHCQKHFAPLKPLLKYLVYKLHLAEWLDACLFQIAKFKNNRTNRIYLAQHPGIIIPPDYALYETYQLNYQQFIDDGKLAATEIIAWTKPYIHSESPVMLDWGCGVGRIIRHMHTLQPLAVLHGCDINEEMIDWDKQHYTNIGFSTIRNTNTSYTSSSFDLVYGLSVFTHIDTTEQLSWLTELHRILKPGGILFITTQGSKYLNKLLPVQKKMLTKNGIYTQYYQQHGHRMMSTYHHAPSFRKMLEQFFVVKEFYEGRTNPAKAGGQDTWILQK